jgi:SAM-dependent methyltransferase
MISGAFHWLVAQNIRICDSVTPDYVNSRCASQEYLKQCLAIFEQYNGATVLDVGAGRTWHFDREIKERHGIRLIGLDLDDSEMARNPLLDERIREDASRSLHVPPGSVDVITARTVVEHLEDSAAFLSRAFEALRSGGQLVILIPNKYAPFALLNRALPRSLSHWLLRHLIPDSPGVLGFRAYYDRTTFSSFERLLRSAGFTVRYSYSSYFSSWYFRFLLPLYLTSLLFDHLRWATGVRALSSFDLFVAAKPQQIVEQCTPIIADKRGNNHTATFTSVADEACALRQNARHGGL